MSEINNINTNTSNDVDKRYVSLRRLEKYDTLIKEEIEKGDSEVTSDIKSYLNTNYLDKNGINSALSTNHYNKTEVDNLLDGKASYTHTHDYAASGHNHDNDYADINHNHDAAYAAKTHNHTIGDIDKLQEKLDDKADSNHGHKYAGSTSDGGAATSANKVSNSLTIKLNSGNTEGTNLFTFDGSTQKNINITPASIGASASGHNHDGTYYGKADGDELSRTLTNVKEDVDAFFNGALSDTNVEQVKDTLREIQEYIDSDTNAASEMLVAISGKADKEHNHTVSEITDLTNNYYNKTELNGLFNNKADSSALNGKVDKTTLSSYYTKTETNELLSGKADTNHAHDYAAKTHNHDDRYYTETELDTKFTSYYNKTEVENKLSGKADKTTLSSYYNKDEIDNTLSNHYTKTEVNVELAKKSNNHDHPYLPLTGGDMSGHIYLTGAKESSSTGSTSQIIFGTSTNEHVALSSNTNMIVINPDSKSTNGQILLKLDGLSTFPSGIQGDVTGNLTGNASTATKATKDASGNVITSTYETKANVAANYYTKEQVDAMSLITIDDIDAICSANIVAASEVTY